MIGGFKLLPIELREGVSKLSGQSLNRYRNTPSNKECQYDIDFIVGYLATIGNPL
jgi:hypothetical protein